MKKPIIFFLTISLAACGDGMDVSGQGDAKTPSPATSVRDKAANNVLYLKDGTGLTLGKKFVKIMSSLRRAVRYRNLVWQ